MPKVSIIVPVYNVKRDYMDSCMNSIMRQSFRDFEVILVDDGSTDDHSGELCDAYAEKDCRVKVIHQKNQGVSAARNAGTQAANGTYLMYVDSDDIVSETSVEEAVSAIEATDSDMVLGTIKQIYSHAEFTESGCVDRSKYILGEEELVNRVRQLYPSGASRRLEGFPEGAYINRGPYARIMRTALAKSNPFPQGFAIGEDFIWNMALLNKCTKICVVPNIWYGYLTHGASAVRKYYGNREEVVSRYLKRLWSENEAYWKANLRAFALNTMIEFYCLLNYELLSEKCPFSNREKRNLARKYLAQEPWNILNNREIVKTFPKVHQIILALCPSGMWTVALRLKNKLRRTNDV